MSIKNFNLAAKKAISNSDLQTALGALQNKFVKHRATRINATEDYKNIQQKAIKAKNDGLNNLNQYLNEFASNLQKNGAKVYHAKTLDKANEVVGEICSMYRAKLVGKSKSMVSEEMELREYLEAQGIEVFENDLGEYIIQLAKEKPSHIIAPALHKTKEQIKQLLEEKLNIKIQDTSIEGIVRLVRNELRKKFLQADVGITGANLLIAESGSIAIVTNEGNADLSANMSKAHIVVTTIDKIVKTFEDASHILKLLTVNATGQKSTSYISFYSRNIQSKELKKQPDLHVVLIDAKRSEILKSEYKEMLRCIKCGACLNHCPVYSNVGGHTYANTYPGPMGIVLNPLLKSIESNAHLPHASSFCGRCDEICPMQIPLTDLMRKLRNKSQELKLINNIFIKYFMILSMRPKLYYWLNKIGLKFYPLHRFVLKYMPATSLIPKPQSSQSFFDLYHSYQKNKRKKK